MTNLSSGIKEMILNNLANLSNLRTKRDDPVEGIKEETTTIKSKTFHPSLKKYIFFFSAKNLIKISIKKKIVIETSRPNRMLSAKLLLKSNVPTPTMTDENNIMRVTNT